MQKGGAVFKRDRSTGDRERLRRRAAIVACALVTLTPLLANCGSGDGGERLSEEEWIAQADAVCAEAQGELDALPEPTTPTELAELTKEAVAIAERQLARLRELRPPGPAEDDYSSMLDLTEQQIEISGEIAEAAAAGDQALVEELIAEGQAVDDEADQLAAGYGFDECGAD